MQALLTRAVDTLLGLSPYTPQLQSVQPAPPAPLPTLHDDVLLAILSHSSLKTVTLMMATCHLLYHEGAKAILRNWPVAFDSIGSELKARSLLCFLQAEQLSRCSHVRRLYISMQTMPSAFARSLAGLLPFMTSLKSLLLDIEHPLRYHPSLFSAFVALRSIEDLVVKGAERSCELIQSLPSSLVSAQLFFTPQNEEARQPLYSTAEFHPLAILQRSALTLKTLTCGFWWDIDPRAFISLPKVSYPNMHTFVFYESRSPTLAPYVKSFPNLAHLAIADSSLTPRWHSDHAQLAVIQRKMNLAQCSAPESPSWKQLCDYDGRLVDLWFLGLSCPIPRLILDDTPTERPPLALTDVLAYAHPTELTIAFSRCSLTDVLRSDFLSALGAEDASGLRRLTLSIELDAKEDRDLDVGRALEDIAATISRLNLTNLSIELNEVNLGKPEKAAGSKSLSREQRTLDEFDVQEFMSCLALSIPTLQDAVMSIQSPRRRGATKQGVTHARLKRRASASAPVSEPVTCKEAGCEKDSDKWWAERACGAERHAINKR
ncbi:hypothetical protein V8D89_011821 [Ganoderma adspersum]